MPVSLPTPRQRRLTALTLLSCLALAGCGATPVDPASNSAQPGDCLQAVEYKRLQKAIARCNAVVSAHPKHPQPRNDRALLYSLQGNTAAACRDSQEASRLLKAAQGQAEATDPFLREEIERRASSCRLWLTNPPATGAPSAESRRGATS